MTVDYTRPIPEFIIGRLYKVTNTSSYGFELRQTQFGTYLRPVGFFVYTDQVFMLHSFMKVIDRDFDGHEATMPIFLGFDRQRGTSKDFTFASENNLRFLEEVFVKS